jgi:hypothetical protein
MHFVMESVFVGAYCVCTFYIVKNVLRLKGGKKASVLFVCGFLKHFLSYVIGLHDHYCNAGFACNKTNGENPKKIAVQSWLAVDSVLEGALFVVFGTLVFHLLAGAGTGVGTGWFEPLAYFVLGVALHLLAETVRVHAWFCRERCISQ